MYDNKLYFFIIVLIYIFLILYTVYIFHNQILKLSKIGDILNIKRDNEQE